MRVAHASLGTPGRRSGVPVVGRPWNSATRCAFPKTTTDPPAATNEPHLRSMQMPITGSARKGVRPYGADTHSPPLPRRQKSGTASRACAPSAVSISRTTSVRHASNVVLNRIS